MLTRLTDDGQIVVDLLTHWLPVAPIAATALGSLLVLPLLLADGLGRGGRTRSIDTR